MFNVLLLLVKTQSFYYEEVIINVFVTDSSRATLFVAILRGLGEVHYCQVGRCNGKTASLGWAPVSGLHNNKMARPTLAFSSGNVWLFKLKPI